MFQIVSTNLLIFLFDLYLTLAGSINVNIICRIYEFVQCQAMVLCCVITTIYN